MIDMETCVVWRTVRGRIQERCGTEKGRKKKSLGALGSKHREESSFCLSVYPCARVCLPVCLAPAEDDGDINKRTSVCNVLIVKVIPGYIGRRY
jgi:hypothetical protein